MLGRGVVAPLALSVPKAASLIKSQDGKVNALSKVIISALRFTALRRTPQTSQRPVKSSILPIIKPVCCERLESLMIVWAAVRMFNSEVRFGTSSKSMSNCSKVKWRPKSM